MTKLAATYRRETSHFHDNLLSAATRGAQSLAGKSKTKKQSSAQTRHALMSAKGEEAYVELGAVRVIATAKLPIKLPCRATFRAPTMAHA